MHFYFQMKSIGVFDRFLIGIDAGFARPLIVISHYVLLWPIVVPNTCLLRYLVIYLISVWISILSEISLEIKGD